MLKFDWYPEATSFDSLDLRGAYLVGAEGAPVRGELTIEGNTIACGARTQEALGLAVVWKLPDQRSVQLETTRLPARDKPYHLHVELVRHRLMRITHKREEWGLFDFPGTEAIDEAVAEARRLFIEAVKYIDDGPRAAELASEALDKAIAASEQLCEFHADIFFERRQQSAGFSGGFLGAEVTEDTPAEAIEKYGADHFDFVQLPFVWRQVQPQEGAQEFQAIDRWADACDAEGIALRGGPLLNFGVRFVPDWMYRWESDYSAVFNYAREHVRRTVQRYADRIDTWVVASGLHADHVFSFNFEQVIDLTRMAATVAKQAAPRARVVIDLIQPWGEYFARDQRTVPPRLYAEVVVQSGIQFDAFGVQFAFGLDSEGYYFRDLLQISHMIDKLAGIGKPLQITALAVPGGDGADATLPWDEDQQADWLEKFLQIAASKPYVESICLQSLVDGIGGVIPNSGVVHADLSPKAALEVIDHLRSEMRA